MTDHVEDSRQRWDANAEIWDNRMDADGNRWHLELIAPSALNLLDVKPDQTVLDIGCGNGVFSRRLAGMDVNVVAFDFSEKMIENAVSRSEDSTDRIDYRVLSATDEEGMLGLGEGRFDSAVANMALMDIADIKPLARVMARLLKPGGAFVFSVMHPCFATPGLREVKIKEEVGKASLENESLMTSRYIKSETYEGVSIRNQPEATRYFHRPLWDLLGTFFSCALVLDGLEEPVFSPEDPADAWTRIAPVLVARLRSGS